MKNPRFVLTPEAKTALDVLFAKCGDQVHEEQLVDAARPKDSVLHDLFPWDDHRAAEDYRKQIAARILRSYHVVRFRIVQGAPRTSVDVPFAVKVKPSPDEEKVWIKTQVALKNEYSRDQLIAERIAWVRRGIKQLLVIPELVSLYEKLNRVIEEFQPEKDAPPASGVQ